MGFLCNTLKHAFLNPDNSHQIGPRTAKQDQSGTKLSVIPNLMWHLIALVWNLSVSHPVHLHRSEQFVLYFCLLCHERPRVNSKEPRWMPHARLDSWRRQLTTLKSRRFETSRLSVCMKKHQLTLCLNETTSIVRKVYNAFSLCINIILCSFIHPWHLYKFQMLILMKGCDVVLCSL